MKYSNCCGSPARESDELTGLCPNCKEHTEFENLKVMKIQTLVTHTEYVDKEIELPYFFRTDAGVYKIVDNDKALQVNARYGVRIWMTSTCYSDIGKGTPITEIEFKEELNKALENIVSLNLTTKVA